MKKKTSKQAVLFETPFEQNLDANNRWVILSKLIPWELLEKKYNENMSKGKGSGNGISPRIAIGALLIKHKLDLSDRETVEQIRENVYLQYFLGFSSFCNKMPFDASSFVHFRKRFSWEQIEEVIEELARESEAAALEAEAKKAEENKAKRKDDDSKGQEEEKIEQGESKEVNADEATGEAAGTNQGFMIIDSTVCPQDISYPTDVNLLETARLKTEEIIDDLCKITGKSKPRTYQKVALKEYKSFVLKKRPGKKAIRKQVKKELQYLRRNLKHIDKILDEYEGKRFEQGEYVNVLTLLDKKLYRYLLIIREIYRQQLEMYNKNEHRCEERIVNLHQPHIRPIKRGKLRAQTEFGAKICSFIDHHNIRHVHRVDWRASNDNEDLQAAAERFKRIFGYYPLEIKADKQYRSKENRKWCELRNIKLSGQGPGRKKADVTGKEIPGERNAIEGTFGNLKQHYGLQRVKAKLQQTSEAWIAMSFLVLNLWCTCSTLIFSLFFMLFYQIKTHFLSVGGKQLQTFNSKISISYR